MLRLPLLKCLVETRLQIAFQAAAAAAAAEATQLQQRLHLRHKWHHGTSSNCCHAAIQAGSSGQAPDPVNSWVQHNGSNPKEGQKHHLLLASQQCSTGHSTGHSTWQHLLLGPARSASTSYSLSSWTLPLLPHTCGCDQRRLFQHNRPGPPSKRPPAPPSRPRPNTSKALPCHNSKITAHELMVVFPDGSRQLLGLGAAREAARGLGLDLVEVNPRASPPVAKIMNFYEVIKKHEEAEKARRLQEKLATPKEMQFSARIADHDLEVKLKKVAGWLEQGYRVQLVVKHGREELAAAQEALEYLLVRVQSEFTVEVSARQVQRRAVSCVVKPPPPPPAGAGAGGAAQQQQQQEQH